MDLCVICCLTYLPKDTLVHQETWTQLFRLVVLTVKFAKQDLSSSPIMLCNYILKKWTDICYMLLKYLAAFKMNAGLILAKWVTRLGMYWNRMERLQLCCTANCGSSILLIFFTKTVVVWRYSFVYTNQFFNLIYFILNKEAWVGSEWNIWKKWRG